MIVSREHPNTRCVVWRSPCSLSVCFLVEQKKAQITPSWRFCTPKVWTPLTSVSLPTRSAHVPLCVCKHAESCYCPCGVQHQNARHGTHRQNARNAQQQDTKNMNKQYIWNILKPPMGSVWLWVRVASLWDSHFKIAVPSLSNIVKPSKQYLEPTTSWRKNIHLRIIPMKIMKMLFSNTFPIWKFLTK